MIRAALLILLLSACAPQPNPVPWPAAESVYCSKVENQEKAVCLAFKK